MAAPIIKFNGRWGGKLRDQNLDIVSGDDLTLQVTVRNTDNSLKDLTSGTVTWALSRRRGTEALISKTGTLSDPTNGVLTISIDSTEDLSDEYYHEAQFTESGGAIGTIMRGPVNIDRDTVNS